MTNENQKDDWVDEPAEPAVKPKAETKPEAKPKKKAERKKAVSKKKPAKKTKAAKVAGKTHPILKGRKTPGKVAKGKKKAEPRSKITLNFKVIPSEAKAIRKLADDKFKGNVTQMIRAKLLGLSVSKEALSSIRKTTRT